MKDSSIVNSKNNIISFNKTGVKLYKKHEDYKLGGTLHSELDQIKGNSSDIYKDEFSKMKTKSKVDSIQIFKNKNSFIIPSLIKYSISQENLSLNPIYRITIQNESNIHFDLDGIKLLNDEDIIFIFNKNHSIEANQSIIIGNDEEVNNNKNYFYNSNINYNNLNHLKLNIKLTN